GEHVLAHQGSRHLSCPFRGGDAGEQAMSCVGGLYLTLLFLSVKCYHICLFFFRPKNFIESYLQVLCLRSPLVCEIGITQAHGRFRRLDPGVVGIPLNLTKGYWAFCQGTVLIKNGIMRILPPLICESLRGLGGVFKESVAVNVAILVDPFHGFLDI